MKRALETLLDAFEAVFDKVMLRACLKNMFLALLFYFFALFVVSRVPILWVRIILLSLSSIGVYSMLVITFGALCRAIYLKKIRHQTPDLNKCLEFAVFFAPAYIAIPAIMVIIGAIVKIISAIVFFVGTIPGVGELVVGLLFIPLTLVGSVIAFLFAASLFFTPAIIATEERGLVFTLRRLVELAEKEPLRLLVYFLLGMVVTSVFTLSVIMMLSIMVPSMVKLSSFITGVSFDNFFASLGGYLVYSPDVLDISKVGITFHGGALLLYLTLGAVAALAFTPPAIYLCSASTLLYQLFTPEKPIRSFGEKEDELQPGKASPEIKEKKNRK